MKKIQITLNIDDQKVTRNYAVENDILEINWNDVAEDMADTLETPVFFK